MEKFFAKDYAVTTKGEVVSYKKGKRHFLKASPNPHFSNYLCVTPYIDGKRVVRIVHRLVAQMFIPNPENKPEVNHINGIKIDNRVENLEWVTESENKRHAYATGLNGTGEKHWNSKLTNEQAVFIRNNPDNLTQNELAEMFGVNITRISAVQRGKTYTNAGGTIRESLKPRVSDEIRGEVRKLNHHDGYDIPTLSKMFGISKTTIFRIIHDCKADNQA